MLAAQGHRTAWGGFPYLAPVFFTGPVHIRLVLFGIGGGGPSVTVMPAKDAGARSGGA